MRAGDRAWLTLGVAIAAYEWRAVDGELLSEAADRWIARHPWLVRLAVFMVASHVANVSPQWCDPLHWAFRLRRA
ncbi:MAG: DUF7427 family protein [Mycobacterium sp.]